MKGKKTGSSFQKNIDKFNIDKILTHLTLQLAEILRKM